MTVLPDTSIWVDYLRRGSGELSNRLDQELRRESVVTCGPVLAELLKGTPPEHRESLWSSVGTTHWIELDRQGWRDVGEVAYDLRRRGATVPLVDVVIATSAVSADTEVWTTDSDFERIQEVLPRLRLYRP